MGRRRPSKEELQQKVENAKAELKRREKPVAIFQKGQFTDRYAVRTSLTAIISLKVLERRLRRV